MFPFNHLLAIQLGRGTISQPHKKYTACWVAAL